MQISCSAEWGSADSVEVRFRFLKGHQNRRGSVISRERVSSHSSVTVADAAQLLGVRGHGREIMVALMSKHPELDSKATVMAYRCGRLLRNRSLRKSCSFLL